jgi:hypothetical protein
MGFIVAILSGGNRRKQVRKLTGRNIPLLLWCRSVYAGRSMARASVRQMWKDKIEGKTSAKAWPEAPSLARPPFAGRVLGIDPSLRGTGLALIEFAPGRTPVLLRCRR